MANTLQYLHQKHATIHIGIHGEIKISDFGWRAHAPGNRRENLSATLDHVSPEMVNLEDDNPYDENIDIWSLGVLLYEFLVA